MLIRRKTMMSTVMHDINVIQTHTNLVSSRIVRYQPYTASVVCDEGYSIYEITIKMGGTDITATAFDPTYNMISIASVTGDVDIECYAMHSIPSDYIRVDGIKAKNNASYLDTGYKVIPNSRLEIKMTLARYNAYTYYAGSKNDNSAKKGSGWYTDTATPRYVKVFNNLSDRISTGLLAPIDGDVYHELILDYYKKTHSVKGGSTVSITEKTSVDDDNFYLFRPLTGSGSLVTQSSPNTIGYFHIYDYSIASYVRYYIPCLNDSGVAGFWDAARGVFQESSNSTAFEEVFEGTTISSQFTKRTTADGATLALPTAKVISVKGNTLVWNQLVTPAATTVRGITTTVSDGVITINGTSLPNAGGRTTPLTTTNPSLIANHKYYICTPTKLSGWAIQWYLSNSTTAAIVANVPEGRNIVTITTTATCIFGGNFDGEKAYNYKGYIIIVDLTQMFGAGNEPTITQFEKWFALGYYARKAASLLNFTATSLASKNAVGTTIWNEALDVTTITGKVDGEGDSVAIFPDGMKRAGNYYDEIVKEDGVWVAYKRVNKYTVDMSSGTWTAWGQTYVSNVLLGENAAHKSGSNLNPVSDKMYVAKTTTMNGTDLTGHFGINNTGVYVSATDYNNRANIGTFTICYPLGTPIKYVLDNPLPEYYKALTGGVEQILPENGATPTTSPADMNITYKTIE